MKLIIDQHGRIDVLGERCHVPDESWKQIQSIPCSDNPVWYSAYPLTGGAVCVQEGTFKIIGTVTEEHINVHFRQCLKGGAGMFNPAAETVMLLWEAYNS